MKCNRTTWYRLSWQSSLLSSRSTDHCPDRHAHLGFPRPLKLTVFDTKLCSITRDPISPMKPDPLNFSPTHKNTFPKCQLDHNAIETLHSFCDQSNISQKVDLKGLKSRPGGQG